MVVTRQQVDQVCLRYPCYKCGAQPGYWCMTTGGIAAQLLHVSRFTQAVAAGELPIKDEDPTTSSR